MSCFCDYEPAEFYHKETHKARLRHRCDECYSAISPGEAYERVRAKWDGQICTYKTCGRCVALREHLAAHLRCFCWAHGSLHEDIKGYVESLPTEANGSGLLFELGRMAVAIRRAPRFVKGSAT